MIKMIKIAEIKVYLPNGLILKKGFQTDNKAPLKVIIKGIKTLAKHGAQAYVYHKRQLAISKR